MKKIHEKLKSALLVNDINFLMNHRSYFSIDEEFLDEDGDSLLMYALSSKDSSSELISYLVDEKANLLFQNKIGENIIHAIVYSGIADRLNKFANKSNINHQSIDGTTPLLLAIGVEDSVMAKKLISMGADINLFDYEYNSPLHVASFNGDFDLVCELIEKGANSKLKTKKGNLPIAIAANEGHCLIVKLLYEQMCK